MISFDETVRLLKIQERLKAATFHEIRKDGLHKSSEGAVTISFVLPPVVGEQESPYWAVDIWSYLLCPNARREVFLGKTASEAISKAEYAAKIWCMTSEMEMFEKSIGMGEADELFSNEFGSYPR